MLLMGAYYSQTARMLSIIRHNSRGFLGPKGSRGTSGKFPTLSKSGLEPSLRLDFINVHRATRIDCAANLDVLSDLP